MKNDGATKIIAILFSHELAYECDLTVHRQIDWQRKCASTHSAICLALDGGRPPIISNNLQDGKLSEGGQKANTTQYKSQAPHMIQLTTAKQKSGFQCYCKVEMGITQETGDDYTG